MERECPLHGDLLESIFSHVPIIDLLPALHVSKTWRRAALSSFHRRQKRPWLFIQLVFLNHHRPGFSAAYDPYSKSWCILPHVNPPPDITCPFLPLHFPFGPHAATWPLLPPPLLHRHNAVTSIVDRTVIIAGGVCKLGYHTCAVESLSLDSPSFEWKNCEPMPDSLSQLSPLSWLASAASNSRLYVLERGGTANPSRLAWFDLALGRWSSVRLLILGNGVRCIAAIGMAPDAPDGADRLIVVGLMHSGALGIWEVEPDSCGFREIGMLPAEAAARIVLEVNWGIPPVGFLNFGGFGFLYHAAGIGEVFACEFGNGKWNWEAIERPPVVAEEHPPALIGFRCAVPALEDLMAAYEQSGRSRNG